MEEVFKEALKIEEKLKNVQRLNAKNYIYATQPQLISKKVVLNSFILTLGIVNLLLFFIGRSFPNLLTGTFSTCWGAIFLTVGVKTYRNEKRMWEKGKQEVAKIMMEVEKLEDALKIK